MRLSWILGALLAAGCGPQAESDVGADAPGLATSQQQIRYCDPADPTCDPLGDPSVCPTVLADPPTTTSSYGCDVTLLDRLGRPVPGQTVTLTASWCNRTDTYAQGFASAVTGADGRVSISLSSRGANILQCEVTTTDPIDVRRTLQQSSRFLSGTRISFNASKYPTPNATRFPNGLVAGAGQMDLYQSGTYDRVVLIPEYFDLKENDPTRRRTRNKFFNETSALIQELFNSGYDVWLFQPSSTGANLHEQAAEFAQAIDIADRQYAVPGCVGHRVGVVGLNTAGVVARIATARWEADAAWRSALGLPVTNPPVAFLASADAPQYGLNLNLDLQKFIQDEVSGADIHKLYNLDSCAINQLLRQARRPDGSVTSDAFKAFFVDGTSVTYYSKLAGGNVTCAAGPAVATLNQSRGVPGWPTTPRRFGVSFGNSVQNNQCYGDFKDLNGAGENVCLFMSDFGSAVPFIPSPGDSWLKFVVNNWFDRYADARAEDLVPGSRSPFFIDGMLRDGFFDVTARQRFSPTFIPLTSAQGTQGPVGGNLWGQVPSPFASSDWAENLYNSVADSAPIVPMISLVNSLKSNMVCSWRDNIVIVDPPILLGP